MLPKETKKEVDRTPKEESNKKFHVVAGAFSLETNANNFASKLQSKGYKTFVVRDNIKNHFNVSIGKFASREEAHEYIATNSNTEFTFWVKEILP